TDDVFISINNVAVKDWLDVIDQISAKPAEIVQVIVLRQGQEIKLQVIPEKVMRNGKEVGRIGLGYKSGATYPDDMRISHRFSFIESIPRSLSQTWDNSLLTLKMMSKIFSGEISVKNLSGPVSIARYAGISASAGLSRFMDFLAIVSISLGVLNLLPIPVLDGGHLTYYLIEVLRNKPVSEETQEFASRIGIVLLLSLMSIALYNDILRVLG
ncbi:MAG: RIP metalloprotease RseP, partial [Gammaproteobacteria bacterium]|nr:RIP metalloprotease RseP [Gammaproteobacteria bacterium]